MRCYWAQAAEGTAALLKHILAFQPPRRTSVVLPKISHSGDVESSAQGQFEGCPPHGPASAFKGWSEE